MPIRKTVTYAAIVVMAQLQECLKFLPRKAHPSLTGVIRPASDAVMQPLEAVEHRVEVLLAVHKGRFTQPLAQFWNPCVALVGKPGHGFLVL